MSDIVEYKPAGSELSIKLSPSIVRRYLVSGNGPVTDQEVMMFLMLCRNHGLDPFKREAYLIKYGTASATIVIGKDTFTKRAEADPDYRGMQAGVIVEREGDLVEQVGSFTRATDKILGGWAKVWKAEREVPYYVTVSFDEYVGRKSNGEVNRQWNDKPATMIRKVALVQALREAFPDSLGGMYDAAEMTHVDPSELPVKDVSPVSTERQAYQEKEPVVDEKVGVEPIDEEASAAFGEPDQNEIF